jgi:hypothetical protein
MNANASRARGWRAPLLEKDRVVAEFIPREHAGTRTELVARSEAHNRVVNLGGVLGSLLAPDTLG